MSYELAQIEQATPLPVVLVWGPPGGKDPYFFVRIDRPAIGHPPTYLRVSGRVILDTWPAWDLGKTPKTP